MWKIWAGLVACVLACIPGARTGAGDEPPKPVKMEYRSFQAEQLQRFAWLGQRVAFLTVRDDLDPAVMAKLCGTFDKVYQFYRDATGREPAKAKLYEGRLTVAEVQKTCGAGCGYLGATGIELMPACFRELYDGVAKRNEYDQALPYEFGRNFWFYSPQLAYKKGADAGSVVTGYAVFMRFPALDAAGAKLGPFRDRSGEEFRREVEGLVDRYLADRSLTWENTLKVGAAPRNPMGLNGTDLFASFCFRLCRDHGGTQVRRPALEGGWPNARRPNRPRTPSTTSSWQPALPRGRTWGRSLPKPGVGPCRNRPDARLRRHGPPRHGMHVSKAPPADVTSATPSPRRGALT